jgi:hypothetical protein
MTPIFEPSMLIAWDDWFTMALTPIRPYSQNFIFLGIYKWAQGANVFVQDKTLQPNVMQHSNSVALFESYKENEVFWIQS